MENLITFLIAWLPTILFLLAIIGGIGVGFWRGFRKSLILAAQAGILFIILVIVYVGVINLESLDRGIYELINSVLALNNTSLEKLTNTAKVYNMTAFLENVVINYLGYGNFLTLWLTNNAGYVTSVSLLLYHLLFAVLFMVIYLILEFILYVFYLLFYSEKRYKKNTYYEHANGNNAYPYRKRRALGALVGGIRGLVSGIILLSFLGTIYYVIGGGLGNKEKIDVKIDDPIINYVVTGYNGFGSYGEQGIFKILNSIGNSDDEPYYLFISDIIFSTKYDNDGYLESAYLREEVGSYMGFVRDSLSLIDKYDQSLLTDSIAHGFDNETSNRLLTVFSNPDFQAEYSQIIDNFEAGSYVLNISLSVLQGLISDYDFNTTLVPQAAGILDLVFKGENAINLNEILTGKDFNTLLQLTLDVLALNNVETTSAYDYVEAVIPSLRKLSIMANENNFAPLNDLFGDIYTYLLNSDMLPNLDIKAELRENQISDIDWYNEITNLMNNMGTIKYFLNDILGEVINNQDINMIDYMLDDLFVSTKNEETFNIVTELLANSKVLMTIFEGTGIISNLLSSLEANYSVKLPPEMNFNNVYDGDKLVTHGEIYNLFMLFKAVAKNEQAKTAFRKLTNVTSSTIDIESVIMDFNIAMYEGSDKTILDGLAESNIFNYILTSIITNQDLTSNVKIYIPEETKDVTEIDGESYVKIKTEDLITTLHNLPTIFDLSDEYLNGNLTVSNLEKLVSDYRVRNLLETDIIALGTISNMVLTICQDNQDIVLTNELLDVEKWISDEEVLKIVKAINNTNISLSELVDGNITIDTIKDWNLSANDVTNLLSSTIIYYTISDKISKMGELVIPYSAYDSKNISTLVDGRKFQPILKTEIKSLLNIGLELLDNDINYQFILNNLNTITNSDILSATVLYESKNELLEAKVDIPTAYESALSKEALIAPNNIWLETDELTKVVKGLDAILDLDSNPNIDFSPAKVKSLFFELNDYYDYNNTKLDVAYESNIISYNISNILSETLSPSLLNLNYLDYLILNGVIIKEEVANLITVLNEYGINNLDTLTTDLIESYIFNSTYDTLTHFYNSRIIAYILTSQLDNTLSNIDNNLLTGAKYTDYPLQGIYKKEDVLNLINAIKYLGIYSLRDLTNLDVNRVISNINNYNISYIYSGSLMKAIITGIIDNTIEQNEYLATTILAKENFSGSWLYTSDELVSLCDFIKTQGDNLSDLNFTNMTLYELNNYLSNSLILNASITKNILTSDFLCVPSSIVNQGTIPISEYQSFANVFGNLTLEDIRNIEEISLNLMDVVYLLNSAIIRLTISRELISNSLFSIPLEIATLVDSNMGQVYEINETELTNFLIACRQGLNVTSISSIEDIKLPTNIDVITNSIIMRASITKNLVELNRTTLYVSQVAAIVTTDINGSSILVLSSSEIQALVNALRLINLTDNFTISLSLANLYNNIGNLATLMESSIMTCYITDLIANPLISPSEEELVYNLTTGDSLTKAVFTYAQIADFLMNFPLL